LQYFKSRQSSGSSTNSVRGLLSNTNENSSPPAAQFEIVGVTPRNRLNPDCNLKQNVSHSNSMTDKFETRMQFNDKRSGQI